MDDLSDYLQEQEERIADKLAELQTSLTNTNSKLDTLNATTAQLSTHHQQIQTSISDVECVDREENTQLHQNLQNNLTHQLDTILSHTSRMLYTCGGTGGWRPVVYLDMTDPSTTCPSGWQLTGYSKRTCGKATHTGYFTCDSAIFPVHGGNYSRVCGRIKAYQYGGIDAFEAYNIREGLTINDAYVSGISLTYGRPREHIWTFAAGATDGNPTTVWVCPCDATVNIDIPPFVNQDYFCETAIRGPWSHHNHHLRFFTADPLWDGEGCGSSSTCCEFNDPPYFTKQLSSPTTDNIEARICIHQPRNDDVAVELLELFVQ